MKKLGYRPLYALWAGLFVLTAGLGLAFPDASDAAGRAAMTVASVVFFVPPFLILAKAKADGDREPVRLVRYLSLTSLVLTVVLLYLNLTSAGMSEDMGRALYAALTVVSAPMVCSNLYVVPLFLWGTLLAGTFTKK